METEFRRLPGVDKVLADERLSRPGQGYPHDLLVDVIRKRLERERLSIAEGKSCASLDEIVISVIADLEAIGKPSLRRVVNASGVILHTNLGRAPSAGSR